MKTNRSQIRICMLVVLLSLLPRFVQAQSFLTNGLVAYYPFNGNVNDASGNGNNGTAVNGASFVPSPLGFAASFNGNSQYISLPGSITVNEDFTATFWVNTSEYNPNGYPYGDFLISRDIYGPASDWNICLGQGRKIQFVTADNALVMDNDLNSNTWVQVACVADSFNQIRTISVNGQVVATTSWQPFTFENNSLPIYLGASTADTGGHAFLKGEMTDVRLYNRALSTNEVAQLYAYESTPANSFLTNGLVAYYRFNGNANDASGNGNDGTAINGVSYVSSPMGSAASFNANSQKYISLPNSITINEDFSSTFWINTSDSNPNGFPSGEFLISRDLGGPSADWNICLGNGRQIQFMTGDTELLLGNDLSPNTWIQVACVADSVSQIKTIFVNGQVAASTSYEPSIFANNFQPIYLGASTVDTSDHAFFTGEMTDVRLYNRALSSNEVAQLYAYESQSTNPPSISSQPQPVTVNAGDNAAFTVTANGTSPLNYQWLLNGTNISGAIASGLTISNVAQTDLGNYAVEVSNAFGSTNSSNAMLSMYPFIETPFIGAITYWGKDVTLSVAGWGTGPLHYQWFKDGFALSNGTNQTLFLPAIQFTNAGLYSIVLSSPLGSVTNKPAQVVVNPAGVSLGMFPGVYVSGVVGYTYAIQASSDLTNPNGWTTVANLTLIQPVQLWVDTAVNALSPANPHKYYRVVPGG